MRRVQPLLFACLMTALPACDALLVDPAAPEQIPLSVVLVAGSAVSGPAEAFDAVDRIDVRLRDGERTVYETTLSFTAAGGDVRVPLSVEAALDGVPLGIDVTLRLEQAPLFDGSGTVTPVAGRTTAAEVALRAVVADVLVEPGTVTLDAIGATAQLAATAVFATGDDIPDASITFAALSSGVVEVTSAGVVRALAEGTVQVEARSGSTTGTASVTVQQVVTAIEFSDRSLTLPVGAGRTFRVTLRDRNGHEVRNRQVQWSSSNPAILQIDGDGVATALATGTVTVTATVDGVSTSITVTVVDPIPIVPSRLSSSATGTRVSLAWQDASDNETYFEVLRRTGAGSQQPFTRAATLAANATSYSEDTAPDRQLEYVVRACNEAGCSGNSMPTVAVTVPVPPINPWLDIASDDVTMVFAWQDVSTWEDAFVIERDDGSGFNVVGQVDVDQTFWAEPASNVYYSYYRVSACNAAGCSLPTVPVTFYSGGGSAALPVIGPSQIRR